MGRFKLMNSVNKQKGSFTVEAALIMPVILGVIVLFIYVAMFCYDRCAIEYVCQSVCTDAAFDGRGGGDIERDVRDRLFGRLAGRWDVDVSLDQDDRFIYITAEATTPLFAKVFVHKARECCESAVITTVYATLDH